MNAERKAIFVAATGRIIFTTDGEVDLSDISEAVGEGVSAVDCSEIEGAIDGDTFEVRQGKVMRKPKPERDRARREKQDFAARGKRAALLSASDWTQVADAPGDRQAWAEYRQELRDITNQPGYPGNIEWPKKP